LIGSAFPATSGEAPLTSGSVPSFPQDAELTASDGAANDRLSGPDPYGAVAISGTTVVAGARYHTVGANADQGAAYVFSAVSGGWSQVAELTASDGQAGDGFGAAVAISGSTIVVGAPGHTDGSNELEGAVYVFSNSAGSWKQVAELTPSDGSESDSFGSAVAITGNTIVVGAPGHGANDGAVYLFTLDGSAWAQTGELTGGSGSQAIGGLVALSGSSIATATVNSPSAVHVYSGLSGTPTQTADISEPQVASLAISGATIVVGDTLDNAKIGQAYVLTDAGGSWTQTQTLTPSPAVTAGGPGDFGHSVAISGNTIAVGAPINTVGSTPLQGTVFTYTQASGGPFSQAAELTAASGSPGWTGSGLAMSGGLIAAGAEDTTVGSNTDQGAVYVFGTSGQSVAGTVSGTSCTDSGCSLPAGVGGFTVLVQGTASDGTPVSETDETAADGSWSVQVPAGSYTAGLSEDGSTFVSPVMEQSVAVGGSAVTGVDFSSCAEGSSSSSTPAAVVDLPRLGSGVGRRVVAHTAAAGFSPSYCESEYNVTVSAKIPQDILVDASEDAHFQEASGEGFNHSQSLVNALRKYNRESKGFNPEFPECINAGKLRYYTGLHLSPEWYSYIRAGTVIGSATVPITWNQSTGQVELEGAPTITHGSVTREFVWQVKLLSGKVERGQCHEKVQVPMMLLPAIGGGSESAAVRTGHAEDESAAAARSFTIVAAWWLPFDAYGATIDPDTSWAEKVTDGAVKLTKAMFNAIGKKGNDLYEAYERLPAYKKFIIETVVGAALGVAEEKVAVEGPGLLAKWLTQYYEGRALTIEELEALEKIGGVMKVIEYGYQVPLEAIGVIEGYTAYPVMSTVIRGQFTTTKSLPSAFATPVGKVMPYQETLAVSANSTKFPNISLKITRDALQTANGDVFEGPLPWQSQSSTPETFNPFSVSNPAYFLTDSQKTGHSYTRGIGAVRSVKDDTSENPEVAYSIRHKGNLASNFAAEQNEAPAPECNAESVSTPNLQTMCWEFQDWHA
jgi:hypothetical protein